MSRPRPILLSTDALDLFDGEFGEVADTCGHLLSRLAEKGLCVDVVTLGSAERVERRDGFGHAIECASSSMLDSFYDSADLLLAPTRRRKTLSRPGSRPR